MNYIPKDGETTTKEYELVLYTFLPDGKSAVLQKDNYDLNKLKGYYSFILVLYNSFVMNEKNTGIEEGKYNSIHVKMLYLERKATLLDMLGNFEIDMTEKKNN